jgi:membrane-associated phospholipid phosphatase
MTGPIEQISSSGGRAGRPTGRRPVSRPGRRYPAQLGWLAARLRPGAPTGLALTAAVVTLAGSAGALGWLTFSVVNHVSIAHNDPRVLSFFVSHRASWLTGLARTLTWLGSGFVLWPVVIIAGLVQWRRRRRWLPAAAPALALAGAAAWSLLIKALVGRPRPPAVYWLSHVDGWSYPSQHAAQALAAWGMLALMMASGRALRTRVLLVTGAALIALVVGLTRLYLAAHWLTDVLAGWALAGVWDSLLIISYLLTRQVTTASPEREARPAGPRTAA